MCYGNFQIDCAISRFQCNLRILRVRNTILRLCKFPDCAEHVCGVVVLDGGVLDL